MAEDFGLKIALQGEREFRKALTDINASFKVLGSEMKLVDAQFKRSDDAQAKYAARGRVLAEQVSAQRDKIATLEAALKNAASNFGESDRRTLAWQTQLNNAKAVLADLEGELEDNNKALAKFGNNADGAGDDLADAAKGADRLEGEVDDLGNELDQTGHKALSFGDVLKANLASEAIVAGVKGIGSAIASIGRGFAGALKDGVAYNAQMETYTASFTTMLGDEAAAHQLVADMKARAASTPYAMDDLASATQTLMSFGMSAEDAQTHMARLGDIAQGDKEKLGSLSLAFAQISSTGKLTGQDLMQMINAGFNPLEEISRKTGKSVGELKEEMSKGAISADMVAEALASATEEGGRFYGAMEKQAGTFSGQMSTLSDGIANLKGQLASGVTDMLAGSVLPMVNGWVTDLSNAFETDGIPGVINALGEVIKEALAFISEQLPMVLDTAMTLVTALAEGLIEALPAITEAALQLVVALVEGIIELLPQLTEAAIVLVTTLVAGIGEALPELIPAAVEAVMMIVQGLVDNLPAILDAALQLILGLAEGLIAAIPVLVEALPAIITGIVEFLVGAIPQLIDAGIQLLTSLVGALPEIIEAIVAAIPEIITGLTTALTESLPTMIDAGIKLLVALIEALPQIIQTLASAMPTIVASIANTLINNAPTIVKAGFTLITALVRNLPAIIGSILRAVPQIISSLVSAFGQGVARMAEVGANLVRGLWNGITSLAGWLWNQVSSWCSSIWDGITGFFGIHSPSRKMAWVGDMLTRGLAGGIDDTKDRTTRAAASMAAGIENTLSGLGQGIDIPVDLTTSSTDLPAVTAPSGLTPNQVHAASGGTGGVDVEGLVRRIVPAMVENLGLKVVLDDGTLVGRLAPRIDHSLASLRATRAPLTV